MNPLELDYELKKLVPLWYQNITEYDTILGIEETQLQALAQSVSTGKADLFVQTMGEQSIQQWEQIFHVIPDVGRESLDFRRTRILNRLSFRLPFTLPFLRRKLDELIGVGRWKLEIDYNAYSILVEYSMEDQPYAIEAAYTIETAKPAHIIYRNMPLVRRGIHMNEEIQQHQRIYHYGLGYWKLGKRSFATEEPKRQYKNRVGLWCLGQLPFAYAATGTYFYQMGAFHLGEHPFAEFLPEGVIKMPSVPSIQPELLEDTAHFVHSNIAKARLNDSILVTALEKEVNGTTAVVKYLVPDGLEVHKVELLDCQNVVLTAASVYVPAGVSTVLKHEIPIKEGFS